MANDLISREAALEAAKTGLKNFVGILWTPDTRRYVPKVVHGVRDALQNVPAIDAVEVVRCKDCTHFKPIPGYTHVDGFCCYSGSQVGKKETGYCNLGERRADHGC